MSAGRCLIEYIAVTTTDGSLVDHRIHGHLLLRNRNAGRRLSGASSANQMTGWLGSSGNAHVLENVGHILDLRLGRIIGLR